MALTDKINEDIKKAMKAREKVRLEALRGIKSALLMAQTEKGDSEITEEKEISILKKLLKQRQESAEIYKQNNRTDLYEKESLEASVIEEYLPEQMSEAEITEHLKRIIEQTGAASPSDMGKVMGTATKELAGKADNKLIAGKVKELLGG